MSPFIALALVASALRPFPPAAMQAASGSSEPVRSVDAPLDVVDGGELPLVPCPGERDDVPLPIERVRTARAGEDVVERQAGGDPFFLSFVGGKHYPPALERVDPALRVGARTTLADGRTDPSTYAFVMFAKRITPERIAALEQLGCRVLGFHPHYSMKVALPAESIDAVAALDFVRWVGGPTPAQKLHTRLLAEAAHWPQDEPIQLYVSVYESDLGAATTYEPRGSVQVGGPGRVREAPGLVDARSVRCRSNGWQQHALEARGVEVLEYVDRIRAFRVRAPVTALSALVALDFVQFVEPDLPEETCHDESMPMVLADYTRAFYDGGTDQAAMLGVIDSGVDVAHAMLDHTYWVGWDETPEGSAVLDNNEHGTHVAGTLIGKAPPGFEGFSGAAPGIGFASTARFRFVKFIDASGASFGTLSDFFSHMRSSFTDIGGNVSPKPHVISNSYGSVATAGSPFFGSEADPRTIDAEVWDHSQLYVFAAGNEGSSVGNQSLREEATAKNALTVGSVVDYLDPAVGAPGNLWSTSSVGPCGDGRWKPNVCAPGRWIRSADANSGTGYVDKSGTSMATPHVAGIAAQLVDHYPTLRYSPHRLASILMATAMTDDDQVLTSPSTSSTDHLNRFGAGRVNAARAHYDWGDDSARTTWAATLAANVGTFADFDVPVGATRLVVCMTYHEDQCSAGAVPALVNDLDLYIDRPGNGIDAALNAGDYVFQQSSIDNTEIRILDDPESGTWRWKVYPESTTGTSRVSVSVVTVSADTTPVGSLSLTSDASYVQPNEDVEITASAYNPEYFASCVFLDSTSSGDVLQASTTTLDDGAETDLTTNPSSGRDVVLGSLRPGDTRSVTWTTRWATEGAKLWEVSSSSDNWDDGILEIQKTIYVDGTPPSLATNLHSTTHAPGVWSRDPTITYAWTAATDAVAGLDGYGIATGSSPILPAALKDIEQVTSFDDTLSSGSWYFSLRSVDHGGNWDDAFASAGPFRIDLLAPLGPSGLHSTTHTPGVPSRDQRVTVEWNAASDTLSGLAGYVVVVNTLPVFDPVGPLNLGPNRTSHTVELDWSRTRRYLHLRARDVAGNWGPTRHLGPFLIWPNVRRSRL